MIMDTSTQHDVMQLEEHGSRVWAVDSSPHDPALLLSASTDRTVRLWRANSENSVGVIAEANQVSISFLVPWQKLVCEFENQMNMCPGACPWRWCCTAALLMSLD